jgi:hypothetical protein
MHDDPTIAGPSRTNLELSIPAYGRISTKEQKDDGARLITVDALRHPLAAVESDIDDSVRRRNRTVHPLEFPLTPYIRSHTQVLPHTAYRSDGGFTVQIYDLRVHKDRPKRGQKPYETIKAVDEMHAIMGFGTPPLFHGLYETVRTRNRLDDILVEERSLFDFERYESHRTMMKL